MDEVFKIADRVAVLRDGELVDDCYTPDLTLDKVVNLMVGRDVDLYESSYINAGQLKEKRIKLKVKNLSREKAFSDVSFILHEGEILGVAGLVGSGRADVMHTIFGIETPDAGEIFIDEEKVEINSVDDAIKKGIALLPGSRKQQGLIMTHTVEGNITLAVLKEFLSGGLLINNRINNFASEKIRDFNIRPGDPKMMTENLSGGNQQKVCIAKWLSTNPKILIIDRPTIGIDVRTKSEIHRLLRKLTERGVSIIIISSEMSELLAHCDRILVMNKGRVLDTFYSEEATQEKIMSLIMDDIMKSNKNEMAMSKAS